MEARSARRFFNLYDGQQTDSLSPLSNWLIEIYNQEGQLPKLCASMHERILDDEQRIQSLSGQIERSESLLRASEAQIEALYNSRSWRWIMRLQKLRRNLFPFSVPREK